MKKLRVIQIGVGHDHTIDVLESVLRLSDVFELVALAILPSEEIDFAERIKQHCDTKGIKKLSVEKALALENIDGAIIETEEINLTKYAQMAADRGLHIHMDKPGGLSVSDYERLINTVKQKGLAFSIGYMYRFNYKVIEALEKIKKGDIGEVYCIEAHMDCEHPKEKRQWLSQFSGGMTFFLGCHLIDIIFRVMGEPLEVEPLNCSTGIDGVTAEDFGMVLFKYRHGYSFAKACAIEPGGFNRRQIVFCGSKGTLEIKPLEIYDNDADPKLNMYTYMNETYANEGWYALGKKQKTSLYNRYDNMMINYAMIALGERENPYTYEYELELYRLVLRACGI